jgi:hypothetical protein
VQSLESLSEGLQNAPWALGKVPHRHHTNRHSTAVNNLSAPAAFTDGCGGLMMLCYGLESGKTQPGMAMRTAILSSGTIASGGLWRRSCFCAEAGTLNPWRLKANYVS